ncbi:MAG: YfhO family protein [Erysipelotrichaceae bacterium]
MKQKDVRYVCLLLGIFVLMIVMAYPQNSLFGSTIDWSNQHVIFPEYFRDLFYQSHQLFPDFATQLGGGQNIYNFSYYGLYSPMVLISTLLPSISMNLILPYFMIFLMGCNIVLIYTFMCQHSENRNACFLASLCFIFATPLFFHTHRQIMFINYMPFLLLALLSLPKVLNHKKKTLFIISIVFIILSSYYYAISCLALICLYTCYLLYKRDQSIKAIFNKDLLRVICCILIAISLCAFLLLPTASTMLEGRSKMHSTSFATLFSIDFSFTSLLYDPYSLGMSAIALFALLWNLFSHKKANRYLSIVLFLILLLPLLWFILNGFLYARMKILIPFLPLFALMILFFLEDIQLVFHKKSYAISMFILILFVLYFSNKDLRYLFMIDCFATLIILYLYAKQSKTISICLFLLLSFTMLLSNNKNENYYSHKNYAQINDKNKLALIKEVKKAPGELYRFEDFSHNIMTSNHIYDLSMWKTSQYSSVNNHLFNQFFYDVMHNPMSARNRVTTTTTSSAIYQQLMGAKYVISKYTLPQNYQLVKKQGVYQLGVNPNVLPLVYASDQSLSETTFDSLAWGDQMSSLMDHVVIKNALPTHHNQVTPLHSKLSILKKSVELNEIKNGIKIKAKKDGNFVVNLDPVINNKIILLSFDVNPLKNAKDKDTVISVNGITNRLSKTSSIYQNKNHKFYYTLSANKHIPYLKFSCSKGEYTLTNFEAYEIDPQTMIDYAQRVQPMKFQGSTSSLANLKGSIDVARDGYLVTSIPYQKGFTIEIDHKKVAYEIVNKAFIGCPIKKGHHTVKISFHAPYKDIGLKISGFTLIAYLLLLIYERKGKHVS